MGRLHRTGATPHHPPEAPERLSRSSNGIDRDLLVGELIPLEARELPARAARSGSPRPA